MDEASWKSTRISDTVGIPCGGHYIWLCCCWPVCGPPLALMSLSIASLVYYVLGGTPGFSPSLFWWIVYTCATVFTAFQDINSSVAAIVGSVASLSFFTYIHVKTQMGYTFLTDVTLVLTSISFTMLIVSLGGALRFQATRASLYHDTENQWKRYVKAAFIPLPLMISTEEAEEMVHSEV